MIDFAAMFPSFHIGSIFLGFVAGLVMGLIVGIMGIALFLPSSASREVLEDDLKRYRNHKFGDHKG